MYYKFMVFLEPFSFCKLIGATVRLGSGHHPEKNGQSEVKSGIRDWTLLPRSRDPFKFVQTAVVGGIG